ncbi:MAG TPA: pyridoxamine 5'-phosphate oxidase family protein [Syntrophorhabdaceae bacterium]|jgi:hypothetical protein
MKGTAKDMRARKEQIPVTTSKGTAAIPERLKAFDAKEYFGVLATDDGGQPYTSLISYALSPDLKRVIFATPKGTRKYSNILHSAQVAILIDNRSKGKNRVLETEAMTILGAAKRIRKGKTWEEFAGILMRKHPDLEGFLNAPTTALIAVEIIRCIHVGSFQTLSVWDCQ